MAGLDGRPALEGMFIRAINAVNESRALLARVGRIERGQDCTIKPLPPPSRDLAIEKLCATVDGSIARLIDREEPPLRHIPE